MFFFIYNDVGCEVRKETSRSVAYRVYVDSYELLFTKDGCIYNLGKKLHPLQLNSC